MQALDTFAEAVAAIVTHPILGPALAAFLLSIRPLWLSIVAALQRRVEQAWREHGADDDDCHVADRVCAESKLMSMLPRSMVQKAVRKSRESGDSDRPPGPVAP